MLKLLEHGKINDKKVGGKMSINTEDLTFEDAMNQLEMIVEKLQNGNISLAESMAAFQDGMTLSQYCANELESAEKTMTKLMDDAGKLQPLDDKQEGN